MSTKAELAAEVQRLNGLLEAERRAAELTRKSLEKDLRDAQGDKQAVTAAHTRLLHGVLNALGRNPEQAMELGAMLGEIAQAQHRAKLYAEITRELSTLRREFSAVCRMMGVAYHGAAEYIVAHGGEDPRAMDRRDDLPF